MTVDITNEMTKKPYHHGDLYHQLIHTAIDMLRRDGEAALSMRKLATELGVSRMAPYHHFEDKHSLLCAIAEEGFKKFVATTNANNSAYDFAKSPEAFTQKNFSLFVKSYVQFAVNNADFYDLMFGGHLWKSNKQTVSLKQSGHQSFKHYLDRIRMLKEMGLLNEQLDPLKFAQISWSMLHGMSRLLIDGIYIDDSAIDAMCDAATGSLWQLLTQDT